METLPISSAQMTFVMNGGVMTTRGTGGGTSGGMMGDGWVTSTFHGVRNGSRNNMVSTYSDGSEEDRAGAFRKEIRSAPDSARRER